jgi:response regulator of citrate/malate metabolism
VLRAACSPGRCVDDASEPGPVIYIEIPLMEFERLHAEIKQYERAVSLLEREIEMLRAEVDRLSRALSHS